MEADRMRRLNDRLRRAGKSAEAVARPVTVLAGLLLVILLEIPWIGDTLQQRGILTVNSAISTAFVFVLTALFFEVRSVSSRIDADRGPDHQLLQLVEVYPKLTTLAASAHKPDEKRLDVLGMTLFMTWPMLRPWLEHPRLDGWTIRLTAVAPDGRAGVPAQWRTHARQNLDSAREAALSPDLKARRISIRTYEYDFMPVVHGLRLGTGDLFMSVLRWRPDGTIEDKVYSYEFVPASDISARAAAYRQLFESWFGQACRQSSAGPDDGDARPAFGDAVPAQPGQRPVEADAGGVVPPHPVQQVVEPERRAHQDVLADQA